MGSLDYPMEGRVVKGSDHVVMRCPDVSRIRRYISLDIVKVAKQGDDKI